MQSRLLHEAGGQRTFAVILQTGDEVLIPDNAYGPNKEFARGELARLGVRYRLYDPLDAADLAAQITPATRLAWLEAPGSVSMEFPDLPALVRICRAQGVCCALDNTWGAGLAFAPFDLLRDGGSLTAPGVRSAYNDAIDSFIEAQGNYDDGLIRAQKMAVSIGGFRGYDGFSAFNLDSYAAGDLEHFIGERAIISDELTKQEKIAALQAAGVPVQLILRELGYDEEDIEDVLAWQEEQARGAVRALAANVVGEDEADEDVDEDADPDATAGTEDAEA